MSEKETIREALEEVGIVVKRNGLYFCGCLDPIKQSSKRYPNEGPYSCARCGYLLGVPPATFTALDGCTVLSADDTATVTAAITSLISDEEGRALKRRALAILDAAVAAAREQK